MESIGRSFAFRVGRVTSVTTRRSSRHSLQHQTRVANDHPGAHVVLQNVALQKEKKKTSDPLRSPDFYVRPPAARLYDPPEVGKGHLVESQVDIPPGPNDYVISSLSLSKLIIVKRPGTLIPDRDDTEKLIRQRKKKKLRRRQVFPY